LKTIGKILVGFIIIRPVVDGAVGIDIFPGFNVPRLWAVLFLLFCGVYLVSRSIIISPSRLTIYLTTFLVLGAVSNAFSDDYILGLSRYLKILTWSVALLVFTDLFRFDYFRRSFPNDLVKLSIVFLVSYLGSFVLSYYFGIQITDKESLYRYEDSRGLISFSGFYSSPTAVGFTALFLFYSWTFVSMTRRTGYFRSMLQMILLLIAFLSLSRAVILAGFVFAIIQYRKRIGLGAVYLISLGLLSLLVLDEAIIEDRIMEDIELSQNASGIDDIMMLGSGRVGMVYYSIVYYLESIWPNILFGLGMDGDFRGTEKYFYRRGAHNDFVMYLVNMGLLGLAFFVLFFYRYVIEYIVRPSQFLQRLAGKESIHFSLVASLLVCMSLQDMTTYMVFLMFIITSAWFRAEALSESFNQKQ
jgi:hypothetical protein